MTGASDNTDDPQAGKHAATTAAGGRWLRRVVLLLAAAESALLIAYIGVMATMLWSSDALGRSIAQGVMTLAAIPLLLLALPALTMGVIDRWLPLALLLIVLALPVAMLLFHYA